MRLRRDSHAYYNQRCCFLLLANGYISSTSGRCRINRTFTELKEQIMHPLDKTDSSVAKQKFKITNWSTYKRAVANQRLTGSNMDPLN